MVIRAVDESGEELQLCSKQKKDHVCVIKTLNTELFMGGGKADVTFYCKGSNGGGCKTKRPSKVKLQAMLRYEDGFKLSYGSAQFLVRGNRRQAGTKPIRYKAEIDEEATVNHPLPSNWNSCNQISGSSGVTPGIFPPNPGFITKISPTAPLLFPLSPFPGRYPSVEPINILPDLSLPVESIKILSEDPDLTLLSSGVLPPLPATVPTPSFSFYPSFPIYPIITSDTEKNILSRSRNLSSPSRKRSIDITTPPPLDTAKRMSIENLLNPNEDSQ